MIFKYAKRLIAGLIQKVILFVNRQTQCSELDDLKIRGLLLVGRHTYGIPKIWMYHGSESKVVIGAYCSISPGVQLIAGGIHPPNWVSTYPFRIKWGMEGAFKDGMPETRGDIRIGSDVWLGTDSMVLSGVTIGHGSIVAAGAVVTRSVPPYCVVAGIPAKIVKSRFNADIVERLLKISWWDWDEERVRKAVPLLSSSDIDKFINSLEIPS